MRPGELILNHRNASRFLASRQVNIMTYIAEILADDVVWLINDQRHLISIHQSRAEAEYYCQKHYKAVPQIVDRRMRFDD